MGSDHPRDLVNLGLVLSVVPHLWSSIWGLTGLYDKEKKLKV